MTTQLLGWFTARQNPALISGGMTASVRLLKCRWAKCCSDEAPAFGFKDSARWLTPCKSAQASVSRLPATVPRKATSCLAAARSAASPTPVPFPSIPDCIAMQFHRTVATGPNPQRRSNQRPKHSPIACRAERTRPARPAKIVACVFFVQNLPVPEINITDKHSVRFICMQ